MRKIGILAVSSIVLLTAQALPGQDGEIKVICSNGFRAALVKLLPEGERVIGRTVKVQYGASANLKGSIEAGESFDLAIMTPQIIDDLVKEGKIAAGTATNLASTGTGIAVRAGRTKPDVSTAQAIKQTLLDAKSVGYVKVGAGTPGILDMFNRLGISQQVARTTAYQEGAEQSMKNVADGKVDLALALVSEILPAAGVQFAGPVPSEFQRKVVMTAGLASSSKNREAAGGFLKTLFNDDAAAKIRASGMDPIANER
jgi:molybdate transport system substrate-binding protein